MSEPYFDGQEGLAEKLTQAEARVKELLKRDGSWMDQWHSCRVCGGEIPHGHTANCDVYKLEARVKELEDYEEQWKHLNAWGDKHGAKGEHSVWETLDNKIARIQSLELAIDQTLEAMSLIVAADEAAIAELEKLGVHYGSVPETVKIAQDLTALLNTVKKDRE